MKTKKVVAIIIIVAAGLAVMLIGMSRDMLYTAYGVYTPADRAAVKRIYDLSFIPTTVPSGGANTYLPQYSSGNDGRKNFYRDTFGMSGNFYEEEDYYYLTDNSGTLFVHKFENLVRFTAAPQGSGRVGQPVTEEEALAVAEKFMENNFLFSYYEETEIFSNDKIYEIRFINRIGNLKNYAFVNTVTTDRFGNVVELSYYTTVYEKFTEVNVKPMSEALYELPVDFPEGTRIDLKGCELVYIYEDSIVQPAYFFKGEFSDGRLFKSFVKAPIYS